MQFILNLMYSNLKLSLLKLKEINLPKIHFNVQVFLWFILCVITQTLPRKKISIEKQNKNSGIIILNKQ